MQTVFFSVFRQAPKFWNQNMLSNSEDFFHFQFDIWTKYLGIHSQKIPFVFERVC